jgi:hypothetical protein
VRGSKVGEGKDECLRGHAKVRRLTAAEDGLPDRPDAPGKPAPLWLSAMPWLPAAGLRPCVGLVLRCTMAIRAERVAERVAERNHIASSSSSSPPTLASWPYPPGAPASSSDGPSPSLS